MSEGESRDQTQGGAGGLRRIDIFGQKSEIQRSADDGEGGEQPYEKYEQTYEEGEGIDQEKEREASEA